ncbi:hypothetical protein [Chlorobium phaeobacteroides]|uniref:Uncharacterized protein n=1 Tax=Chlorobium phaeobacteroides (strain DSM 266 / SMG 266 / 2430) TaxID=290317 RepID=A1BJE2_CHLPD|nr:hypothetical protein [Chlorobium phaeobacteroides]ABL66519.1 hypothetical protein Cpha266_2531 [Chlorobium phaeobacteroides DSM 266]
MATVKSTWATSPIVANGILSAPEWAAAGVMPIPAGFMMVKNDNTFLYVALDMVGDSGADPGVGDYFWFSIDCNGNGAITPGVDVNYSIYPMLPVRIGRQYYLGPGRWTGLQNTPSPAIATNGFGPSPRSRTSHRIWELRIPLSEIGITDLGSHPDPAVHFGLRVASRNPVFTFDFPAGFYSNFSNLHAILLAKTPTFAPGVAGPVIGSVGLIPATSPQINGGYATTAPSYYLHVDEAAFGGTLTIIGNRTTMQSLWAAGARKYRILHRAGSSGAFTPLLQSWNNYRWNGATSTLESIAWDSLQMYPLPDPTKDYSIDDLLIQWNTIGSTGIHELKAEFFRDDPARTPVASAPQTLQLMIDNNIPYTDIINVLHDGAPVAACAMETMTSATDGVQITITVTDLEAHLKDFTLKAHWGNGESTTVYSDNYPAHRNPLHQWSGVTSLVVPPAEWVPPRTCAYQFRLSATARVTNGYTYIGYVEDAYHVTLIKPGSPAPRAIKLTESILPFGQLSGEAAPEIGIEPKKLGIETFPVR